MRVSLLVIVLATLAGPAAARADPPDAAHAQAAMEDYFAGEERGGYVLIGMGVAGMIAGGWLYRTGTPTARGASYPLLGVGVIHLAAGIFVNVSSARRVEKFTRQIETDTPGFLAEERVRMKGVSRQFTALEIAEVVLIAGGLTAAAVGWRTDRPTWKGVGLTLALEAACTLGFDIVAARRAHDYRLALDGTSVAAGVDPATGATTTILSYGGRF
jgi:hypothetical protein